ncbi:MAG TPA: hypothetical protein DFS52_27015, partial [Myxococcales bacterium]|nr:hypothetical protein [Myxococcales bacterium]
MGSFGRAEGEDQTSFPLSYCPIPEHLRAFDPDVVLVVGPRGAGKTELFKAGMELGLLPAISRRFPRLRLPPAEKTTYVKAFPLGHDVPDGRSLKRFVAQEQGDDALADLWFAYLVRTLAENPNQTGLEPLLKPAGGDPAAVLQGFRDCGQRPLLALDDLDAKLEREKRYLYVGYDELDTFG